MFDMIDLGDARDFFSRYAATELQSLRNQSFGTIARSLGGGASSVISPTGEPQKSYMWEIRLYGGNSSSDFLQYYARTISTPMMSTERISRFYAGKQYSYSGKDTSPHTFTITLWDNQDLETYRFFTDWYRTMNDPLSRKVSPRQYHRTAEIQFKDNSDVFVGHTVMMANCWPMEVSSTSLSYDESDSFTFDVVMAYDSDAAGNTDVNTEINRLISDANRFINEKIDDVLDYGQDLIRSIF